MSADTIERNELTAKQQAFVDAYLGCLNATEACRKAGYQGNDDTLKQVGSENLAKPYIKAAIAKRQQSVVRKAEKKIVNVYEEFGKNLEFVGKLRDACEKWLNVTGEFAIEPRTDEIDVVYWDSASKAMVTERLDRVLAKAEMLGNLPKLTPFIKCVDLREYALKVIDRIDTAVDKFAKMGGDYTKDKENPQTVQTAIEMYRLSLQLNPGASEAERNEQLQIVADITKYPAAEIAKGVQDIEILQ